MKFIDFLICDDIRFELKRKITLVGIYSDAINFEVPNTEDIKWPIGIKLGIYARLLPGSPSETPPAGTDFKLIIMHDTRELAGVFGKFFPSPDNSTDIIAMPLVAHIALPGPGSLTFQLIFSDSKQTYFSEFAPYSLKIRTRKAE